MATKKDIQFGFEDGSYPEDDGFTVSMTGERPVYKDVSSIKEVTVAVGAYTTTVLSTGDSKAN